MKKARLIPFSMSPTSWGLRGTQRDFAEAHYYLVGEELERRLLEIEFSGVLTPHDETQFKSKKIQMDLKWGKITEMDAQLAHAALDYPNKRSTEYRQALLDIKHHFGELEEIEYDKAVVELNHKNKDSSDYKIAIANVLKKHDELSEREYSKEIATIKGEPWVELIEAKLKYDPEVGNGFEFELDWNQAFVEDLVNNGWHGASQAEIVDQWFTQTCQDVFNSDPDFMMPEETVAPAATTRRKSDGGKTEFS